MTNAFYYLVKTSGLWSSGGLPESSLVAMLVAGLGHDVGHPGRNNGFLSQTRHALAVTYNERSILENFHAATLTRIVECSYGSDEEGTNVKAQRRKHHIFGAFS